LAYKRNRLFIILVQLAANPHVQTKLRKELINISRDENGNIPYDEINNLPYLDMVLSGILMINVFFRCEYYFICILETMRLYPAALSLHKVCTKPYILPPAYPGGKAIEVEPGTPTTIPIYGLHTNPEFFPDPFMFDPERFNEQNKNSFPKFAYIPFGEGPRICVGKPIVVE
jgi:cytochrome P450